jgi:hypothetical protein
MKQIILLTILTTLIFSSFSFSEEVLYTGSKYKDPFFPPMKLDTKPATKRALFNLPNLTLEGVVWGTDKPMAIINGIVCGVGDTVKEARIIAINQNGVLLNFKGKSFLLKTRR